MTLSNLKKVVNTKTKDKIIPLKMDKEVFARITLLAQFTTIEMKLVFTYPLGPLPWSIADAYGMPRKTNKATLTKTIVKDIPPVYQYPSDAVSIFDGMAVLQKFQQAWNSNFRAVSKSLFNTYTSPVSDCIHVIFDAYRNNSIKYLERQRRSDGAVEGIQHKNILPSFPVKCCGSIAHKRILGNSRPVRQIQRTCDMSGLLKPTARIRGLSTNIYTGMKLHNGEHNITIIPPFMEVPI